MGPAIVSTTRDEVSVHPFRNGAGRERERERWHHTVPRQKLQPSRVTFQLSSVLSQSWASLLREHDVDVAFARIVVTWHFKHTCTLEKRTLETTHCKQPVPIVQKHIQFERERDAVPPVLVLSTGRSRHPWPNGTLQHVILPSMRERQPAQTRHADRRWQRRGEAAFVAQKLCLNTEGLFRKQAETDVVWILLTRVAAVAATDEEKKCCRTTADALLHNRVWCSQGG